MTAESVTIASNYLETLEQAVAAYRQRTSYPAAKTVVAALLAAEKSARHQRIPSSFTALDGQWRLSFTTGVRKLRQGGIALSPGFYLPQFIPAYIGFNSEQGQISNQIQLGGLTIGFTGPARYRDKNNLLAFDFTQIQVKLGPLTAYQGKFRSSQARKQLFEQVPIAQLPFFAFFLIQPDFIAARGRGGGLALWIRDREL